MKRILLLFLIFPIFSGCIEIPGDLSLPQWNSEYNLPLTHKNYVLDDLIKTDEYIKLEDSFMYTASQSDMSDPQGIEEFIEGQLDQSREDVEIPMLNGEGNAGIPFVNGMELDSAHFTRGTLSLAIHNQSNETLTVTMVLPAFRTPDGTALEIQSEIASQGKFDFQQDLDGYKYDASMQQYSSDTLQIDGTVAGGDPQGLIVIDYAFENTMFSYLAGKIPATDISPINSAISLPITDDVADLRDKLTFYDAELVIKGNYFDKLSDSDPNSPFDVRIADFKIRGMRNNNSEEIFLKLNDKPDNNLGPLDLTDGYLETTFTTENSNLSEFLSFMPDSLVVIAESTLNPENLKGAATNEDEIQFGYELSITSVANIKNLTLTDTTDFDMDDDVRDMIKDFRAATIYLKIDNNIGFGGDIVMHFADAGFNTLFSMDTLKFEPAHVDADGNPTTNHTEPTIALDSTQIQYLADSENIIMDVIVNTTRSEEDQKVVFKSTDWLDIISFCKVKYHLNLDEDEEE